MSKRAKKPAVTEEQIESAIEAAKKRAGRCRKASAFFALSRALRELQSAAHRLEKFAESKDETHLLAVTCNVLAAVSVVEFAIVDPVVIAYANENTGGD
jgi:hypothetical protein